MSTGKRSHSELFVVLENGSKQLARYKTLVRASQRSQLRIRTGSTPYGLPLHKALNALDSSLSPQHDDASAFGALIDPDGNARKPFYTGPRKTLYLLPCASGSSPARHVVIVRIRTTIPGGGLEDPFAALVELRALIYLRELLIDSGISPHVVLLLAHRITPRYLYLAVPEATEGDMCSYLQLYRRQHPLSLERFALVCEALLFHVLFTLVWMGRLAPHFHHNDLTLANVLVSPEYPHLPATLRYQTYTGRHYGVPNIGVRALLWDFDYASEPAVLPNVSAVRSHYDLPSYGVHIDGTAGQDFYLLVLNLCTTFRALEHTALGARLLQAFGPNIFVSVYANRRAQPDTPSGWPLLAQLFGHWEVPGGLLGKPHYGATPLQTAALGLPANMSRIYAELPVQTYPAEGAPRPLWYGGYIAPEAEVTIPARLLYSNILVPNILTEDCRVQFTGVWRQQAEAHLRQLILEHQCDSTPEALDARLHNSTAVLQQIVEFLGGVQAPFLNELATLVFFLEESVPRRGLCYELLLEKLDSLDGHKIHALIFHYFWIRQLMKTSQTNPV